MIVTTERQPDGMYSVSSRYGKASDLTFLEAMRQAELDFIRAAREADKR